MTKVFLIILISVSNFTFSQYKTEILKSYIQESENSLDINNKIISNKSFYKILVTDYFNLTFEEDIFEEELENYLIVKNNFDLSNSNIMSLTNTKYPFKTVRRKFNSISLSNILLSNNKKFAIIYEQEDCKGLCGGGNLILLKSINNNEWKIKAILYSWIG